MNKTSISWTNKTWNPTSGCDKVSPGCKNCYAEDIALRWNGRPGFENGFNFTIHRDRFDQPRQMRKPSRIFVNSMSDFFHEEMPIEVIQELFGVMASCPQHTFQILTKRHKRLADLVHHLEFHDNIWIGVSIENQSYVERCDYLRSVPARVRFLSCEPLLGPLELNLSGIHWVIVGGESGPRCRPMDIEWSRSIRAQCISESVPFFMKQLGGHPDDRERLEQFPEDLRIQEFPPLHTDLFSGAAE